MIEVIKSLFEHPQRDSEESQRRSLHLAAAALLVETAPERLLWGSDWPHVTARGGKPDGALLFDLLTQWVPDAAQRRRVLVHNPAKLYGFA